MNSMLFKMMFLFATGTMLTFTACSPGSDNSKNSDSSGAFTVQITDKPFTYCNPLNISIGSGRALRAGEPVVLLHKDEYYLFLTGVKGYWYGPNLRDWTYVDAPDFPGGVPSVASDGETLYACAMNSKDLYTSTDPKQGTWVKTATMDSDRYGDANIFIDDDGRFYMYYGWSQLLPFKVVEIDPHNGFKEIGEPVTLFFGDYESHGFERRRKEDVIFPFFSHREYFPEESPWIEGPWVVKHKGRYYLQYAAIGLEFLSYSHGVYVSKNPKGPFEYSPHNPLTFKTTGFAPGAGHGSTFKDKNGQFWTICMIPSFYGGRGGAEIALYPTDVDDEGVMHSNTAFGDYPQYHPGIKENAVNNNFTGWMLLSRKKYVEVSSTLEGYKPANAVDENFMTFWCAETGNPGEFMTIDLSRECNIYSLQINFDRHDANVQIGRGFGPGPNLDRYQSYTVQVSSDNQTWSTIVDRTNNTRDLRHDYIELDVPVKARYVKLTNVFTPEEGKFAVKDLRIFGNPDEAQFTKVEKVMVARDPVDRRDAKLIWQPVNGADGYVVRYGIEADKLYNNYMVYNDYTLTIHSLNSDQEYYFQVEAFDSGTDYYRERTEQTMGRGAEIELRKGKSTGMGFRAGGDMIERKMIVEGKNEYVFENIEPDFYTLRHTFGPVLWSGELTAAELIGTGDQATVAETLAELGKGLEVLGQIEMKVIPGSTSGKIVLTLKYNDDAQ